MMLLSLMLLAAAAQEVDPDCASPWPPAGCPDSELVRAEAALEAQWLLAAARMKARDDSLDRTHDDRPGHVDTLQAAQRAWIIYRDQHCLAESFAARGGSMAPTLHSGCMARLTKARTEELKELASEP